MVRINGGLRLNYMPKNHDKKQFSFPEMYMFVIFRDKIQYSECTKGQKERLSTKIINIISACLLQLTLFTNVSIAFASIQ